MTFESVAALQALQPVDPQQAGAARALQPGEAAASVGFGQLVSDGIAQVNQQVLTSETDLQRLAVGDVQNLHEIMIRLEESRLSFQLLLQVRNRLLEAYQDVMRTQV